MGASIPDCAKVASLLDALSYRNDGPTAAGSGGDSPLSICVGKGEIAYALSTRHSGGLDPGPMGFH